MMTRVEGRWIGTTQGGNDMKRGFNGSLFGRIPRSLSSSSSTMIPVSFDIGSVCCCAGDDHKYRKSGHTRNINHALEDTQCL